MKKAEEKPRRPMSLLKGSSLFFGMVAYINIRSPEPPQTVDWIVLGVGFAVFAIAVVRWLIAWRGAHSGAPRI
ncbi:MAG: hypothetical protein GC161_16685 [Planctomycetaceae bacterium]|nr:hypothetical protein [Planctomycetaceae bacterium]